MPYADYGEKLEFGESQYSKLKGKGDKIKFRLLGPAFIEGKHFFKDGEDWDIQPCSRINQKKNCEHCKQYFKIMAEGKKSKDKAVFEAAKKEADKFKCSIAVYFPIINRDTEEFTVFQSTIGMRNKIELQVQLDVKVLDVDFIVIRTENPGSDYYTLDRVDSAETKPFTAKEKKGVKKYEGINLAEFVGHDMADYSDNSSANPPHPAKATKAKPKAKVDEDGDNGVPF